MTSSTALLGPAAQQRAAFLRYIAAFNDGDTVTFTSFYTPDVTMTLTTRQMRGPEEIARFYQDMYLRVRETLEVHRIIADEDGIAIEITATFRAHEDDPDFLVAPLGKGDAVQGRMAVLYHLRDGRICDVAVARMGPITGLTETAA